MRCGEGARVWCCGFHGFRYQVRGKPMWSQLLPIQGLANAGNTQATAGRRLDWISPCARRPGEVDVVPSGRVSIT